MGGDCKLAGKLKDLLAANIAESPVDLILLLRRRNREQAKLLAVTIGHVGHTFLEKSGVVEGSSDTTH